MRKKMVFLMVATLMASVISGCKGVSVDINKGSSEASSSESSSSDSSSSEDSGKASGSEAESGNKDTMFQVSLLQGLTEGDFDGSVSAAEYKTMGDTGIGTFDGLNGELVMLDGKIFRAAGDGSVEEVDDSETIPFGNTSFFEADSTQEISDVGSYEELQDILNDSVHELGANYFYVVRIDGSFSEMHVRSELKQEKPYVTINEALEKDQKEFDYKDIEGTMVGIYCPSFMSQLNNVGWHFHFVSDDRSKGGHVFELKVKDAEIGMDFTDDYKVVLPDSEKFQETDFSIDRSADVKKAETKQ